MNKKIIGIILSVKVCIFVIIFLAYSLLPFNSRLYFANFFYTPQSVNLQAAFSTWDAQHYLFLSQNGYHVGNDSNAFSPLFPFAIYLLTLVTRNSFWSGIILANIFSFFGYYLFFTLVKKISNEKTAFASLLALLIFPTNFYFSLIYTESLFFLLIMLFFWLLLLRKLWIASLVAFLIALTRLIGAAIFLPYLSFYILEYHKHNLHDEVLFILKTLFQKKTFLIFSPFLGIGVTMLLMYVTTGNYFAQFDALNNFVSHHSISSVFNPLFFLRELFTYPLAIHGYTNSLIDRIFFLSFLCLLPFIFKRVSFVLSVYAILFGIVPVLSGSFMSYTRYLVVVFPIFIALGKMSLEKKYEKFTFPYLFISIALQTLFLIMHSLSYWVS